ncbi:hypothetical protein A2U01_0118507, partial [Trifolium medium]|nr:hypothetical protein [Trifolium medium]
GGGGCGTENVNGGSGSGEDNSFDNSGGTGDGNEAEILSGGSGDGNNGAETLVAVMAARTKVNTLSGG